MTALLLEKINLAALFSLFIYSIPKMDIKENERLIDLLPRLKKDDLISNSLKNNPVFAQSEISEITLSDNGMTACIFTTPSKEIYPTFKGTGSGEWIDNGEGLSGIPEANTYFHYKDGKITKRQIIKRDFASDQQAEALNWFNRLADKYKWSEDTKITLCGHSKGGNKAQFVFINSSIGQYCFSFNGQGFSPEAVKYFKNTLKESFDIRRKLIYNISADKDYVNVLGKPLMSRENSFFIQTENGFHQMEALLDKNGELLPLGVQGKVSRYAKSVSEELMDMPPFIRQYAVLGIMNIFQKYLGKGEAVNDDKVSLEKTLAGIALSIPSLLNFWRK